MSLHLYLNGGRQSMDGGSKGALGLLREHCKLNGLKIDQYDNYTGGYHLRPDSHWTYSFDGRGQVTGARKRTVTNVSTGAAFLLGGWDAAYSYDDIGNRTTSRFGGDGQESSPVGSEEVGYEVNALNQYTEIENPRAFFVTGSAPAASSVGITLNGVAANRVVPHFWARQEVAGTGPTWADATLVATSGSSTVTVPKHTYVLPAVETPSYDADGNLVSDGRWLYAWDGENRLKEMTTQVVAVSGGVPDLRLTFAYDGRSRRIRKLVEEKVSGSWVTRRDTRFVYEGWNLVAEVEYLGTAPDASPATSVAPRPFLRRTYLWGQDLSNSLQGAGGVGGLLAITRHEHGAVPSKDYWATNDLNGNVIGLITENGLRALYEYDPFGQPLRVSEPEEDLNPFRFSAKYTDPETGLCYYGYRYYDSVRGRWINRDPIEEHGGANLYGMVGNDPLGNYDMLGLIGSGNGMYLPGVTPGPFTPAYVNHPDYGKNPDIPNTFYYWWAVKPCEGKAETRFIQVIENAPWGFFIPLTSILLQKVGEKAPLIDDGTHGLGDVGNAEKDPPFFPTMRDSDGKFYKTFDDTLTYDVSKRMRFYVCRVCACQDGKNILLNEVGPCKEWQGHSLPADLGQTPDLAPSSVWKNTLRDYVERKSGRLVEVRGAVLAWWTTQ